MAWKRGMRSGEMLRIKPQHYYKNDRVVRVVAAEKGGGKAHEAAA